MPAKPGLIPLSASLLEKRGVDQVRAELRRILRSTRFEILKEEHAFHLLGPDTAHHAVDPYLQEGLKAFGEFPTESEILSYRRSGPTFDLCFEDSWSGWFIAQGLAETKEIDDLVLIHVDDHTDMMPTRLMREPGGLIEPASGLNFNPAKPCDWESAIASGSVGIGDFITPLYYGPRRVHVRHVNNAPPGDCPVHSILQTHCRYDLIPDQTLAGIVPAMFNAEADAGTSVAGGDAALVLHELPQGRIIVHVDLDYFINDFNGNPGGHLAVPLSEAYESALQKMELLFEALQNAAQKIDRWIVATSPGFCSARHWPHLLEKIERRIEDLRLSRCQ